MLCAVQALHCSILHFCILQSQYQFQSSETVWGGWQVVVAVHFSGHIVWMLYGK